MLTFIKYFFLLVSNFICSQDWKCPIYDGFLKVEESYQYKISVANLGVNSSKDITIHSTKQSFVYSVSEGEVSRIFFIDNRLKAVLIKNGKEQYSYSHLSSVKVGKGDEIKIGTELGINATSSLSKTKNDFLIKFQYWSNQEQQDVFDRFQCRRE